MRAAVEHWQLAEALAGKIAVEQDGAAILQQHIHVHPAFKHAENAGCLVTRAENIPAVARINRLMARQNLGPDIRG